jgi:hypothetical protein
LLNDPDDDTLSKHPYLVPLGYVAFVAVPILITIGVIASLSGRKPTPPPDDDPPHVARNNVKPAGSNTPKKTPKTGPPSRPSV